MNRLGWIRCLAVLGWLAIASSAPAQDWPQWRGPNRDANASGFHAPATWPAELTQKWKVAVGNGVSTPAVVGDRAFVFTREGDDEIVRCLDAENGDVIWQDKYAAEPATGPAGRYPGPRSSPTVADGKVVTLGVRGTLCCYDAASGKQLWRKDEFRNATPQFFTSSSPIVVEGMCIAQLGGGRGQGGIVAFDLTSGDEQWRWEEDTPAYGSPVLIDVAGTKAVVAPTNRNLVALSLDGKSLWEMPYEQGRYNSATPIFRGDTLIIAGPQSGVTALRFKKQGDKLVEEKLWSNPENSLIYNTPVLKGDLLVGLSTANRLFCINLKNGEATAWTAPITRSEVGAGEAAGRGAENSRDRRVRALYVQATQEQDRERAGRGEGRRGRFGGQGGRGFGGGRRGGGMGGGGFGSVVDAGTALLALSPSGELVVFKPSDAEFAEVARYQVADGGTYAYPVAVGNSIYIKDQDSLARWDVN
jgi:outer membrane protein assembly factor BamB